MRTLKTSIAVLACLLINHFFIRSEYSFYSVVAAVLCMQPNISNSLSAGINRVTGTILGGAAGIILIIATRYFNIEFNSVLYFFITSVFIISLIYFSVAINKKTATQISCIIFLSIAIVHGNDYSTIDFAIIGVIQTIIGIFVSIIINYINLPIKPDKKNLFVTDLDGTFLTSQKVISHKSKKIINKLLKKGLNFTVATARTPATVTNILKDLNLKLPIICMNGSAIYDIKENKYILYHILKPHVYDLLIQIFNENESNCFIHTIKNDRLYVYFEEIKNQPQKEFYDERKNLPLKTYINSKPESNSDIIFLMLLDKTEVIDKIYNQIINSDFYTELSITKYIDIYNSEEYSYLEVYDKTASKKNGVKYLKGYSNTEKLISFGDNANDISMLKASDFSFAVENATDEVKQIADKIIGSNNNDSVAKTIKNFR